MSLCLKMWRCFIGKIWIPMYIGVEYTWMMEGYSTFILGVTISGFLWVMRRLEMKNFFLNLWYDYKEWRYERLCMKHLGMKPTKMYISKEAYDELVRRINEPPDPKVMERFREILRKSAPWDDWQTGTQDPTGHSKYLIIHSYTQTGEWLLSLLLNGK